MEAQADTFSNLLFTASGRPRASVELRQLKTLWFNTGTLCNLACDNCCIESSSSNYRLEFIRLGQVEQFLNEIQLHDLGTEEIGLSGGEPFDNPDIVAIMGMILRRGFRLLVLTNAMAAMLKRKTGLLALQKLYGEQLTVRISIDHCDHGLHQQEPGSNSWQPMLDGLCWLSQQGFNIGVAGRRLCGEDEQVLREAYGALFERHNIDLDAFDEKALVLFPEITTRPNLPEITEDCWQTLNVNPDAMMCASSRMVAVRKGDRQPSVMACRLLAYDQQFSLGASLLEAQGRVQLNHPNCASFCVLGGGAWSV